jgi:serine/threonine-protein kinase HipA
MSTPVWTWLPGSPEPVLAGHVEAAAAGLGRGKFWYEPSYANLARARPLDPVRLRLSASPKVMPILGQATGLPGVLIDAMPSGYGQDRLNARHGRDLSPLELLELGPGDAVGAIAVCHNIDAKMAWRPHSLAELMAQIERLDDDAPSSRAIRSMDLDDGTSAGGERPKATIEVDGSLWIAKLQDRGDSAHLPAREFVVMQLASELGITVPRIRLHRSGGQQGRPPAQPRPAARRHRLAFVQGF